MSVVYLERDGQQFGPFALEEARRYISEGRFGGEDLAWIEGMPEWRQVAQIAQLNFVPAATIPTYTGSIPQSGAITSDRAAPGFGAASYPPGAQPAFTHAEFATFWRRSAAMFVDGFVALFVISLFLVFAGLFLGERFFTSGSRSSALTAFFIVAPGILQVVYFAFWNCTQSMAPPGKILFGLIVVNGNAQRLNFIQSLVREFVKLIGSMFFLLTFFSQPISAKRQCLHDMISGAVVLRKSGTSGLPAAGVWFVNVAVGLLFSSSILLQLVAIWR